MANLRTSVVALTVAVAVAVPAGGSLCSNHVVVGPWMCWLVLRARGAGGCRRRQRQLRDRGRGCALVSLGVWVGPVMRWLALRVCGAGDACVAFDLHCDSFAVDINDDCDCIENDMHNDDDDDGANVTTRAKNGAMARVWSTTMTLFDERGKMRSGSILLRLHPNCANGAMGYEESFLHGGATPGIIVDDNARYGNRRGGGWGEGEDENDNPKWKASLILHELDRFKSSSTSRIVPSSSAAAGGGGGIVDAAPSSGGCWRR